MRRFMHFLLLSVFILSPVLYGKSKSRRSKSSSGEMLVNGSFSGGLDDWSFMRNSEYEDIMADPKVSKKTFKIKIPYVTQSWYALIAQELPTMVEGQTYKLTYECKRTGTGTVNLGIQTQKKEEGQRVNYVGVGCGKHMRGSSAWQRFTIVFEAKNITSEYTQGFSVHFGNFKGEVELRKMSLKKFDDVDGMDLSKEDITIEDLD